MAEQLTVNQWVVSSSLTPGATPEQAKRPLAPSGRGRWSSMVGPEAPMTPLDAVEDEEGKSRADLETEPGELIRPIQDGPS